MIKSRLRTAALMLMAATAALSFTACGGDDEDDDKDSGQTGDASILLERNEYDITDEGEASVNFTLLPDGKPGDVECTSTDEEIFTVVSDVKYAPDFAAHKLTVTIKGVAGGKAQLKIASRKNPNISALVSVNVTETYEHKKQRAMSYLQRQFKAASILPANSMDMKLLSHITGACFQFYPSGKLDAYYKYTEDYLKNTFRLTGSKADTAAYYKTCDNFTYTVEPNNKDPFSGKIKVKRGNVQLWTLIYGFLGKAGMILEEECIPTYGGCIYTMYAVKDTDKKPTLYGITPEPLTWDLVGQWKQPLGSSGSSDMQESLVMYVPLDLSGTAIGGFNCYSYTSAGATKNGKQTGRFYEINRTSFFLEKYSASARTMEVNLGAAGKETFNNFNYGSSCNRTRTDAKGTTYAAENLTYLSTQKPIYDYSGNLKYQP